MSVLKTAMWLVLMGFCLAACARSPEQLTAECTATTAHRLEAGLGVPSVDLDRIPSSAFDTCGQAFEATGNARAAFGAGRAALANERYDLALEWFDKALDGMYRKDLTQIGIMSTYASRNTGDDIAKAIMAGEAAIAEGTLDAAVTLGQIYVSAAYGHYDFDEAVKHFTTASRTEYYGPYAKQQLSAMYFERAESGNSPNAGRDFINSLRWTVDWAKSDPTNVDAWVRAGDLVMLDAYPALETDSERIAYENYKKAADLGSAYAAVRVGWALAFGRGTTENTAAARPYLDIAAKAGYAYAHYVLALLYWTGDGVAKNAGLAEQHVQEAIKGGQQEASELHGQMEPVLAALRAGTKKESQSCMDGRRSQLNQTIYEVYNVCAEPVNVLICENYAVTDFIGFFQGKDYTSCRIKYVGGGGFVESMYFSEADAALGWQLISGSKLEWGACYAPLKPSIGEGNKIRCDW